MGKRALNMNYCLNLYWISCSVCMMNTIVMRRRIHKKHHLLHIYKENRPKISLEIQFLREWCLEMVSVMREWIIYMKTLYNK